MSARERTGLEKEAAPCTPEPYLWARDRRREPFWTAGSVNPHCSKSALGGGRGAGTQNPRPRPIWLGRCVLSRMELDHGAFQLPGALQRQGSSKHHKRRKLGRRIPRGGGTGASTEHVQTLCRRLPLSPTSQGRGCLLSPSPGRSLSLPCASQAQRVVMSAAGMAIVWWPSQRLNAVFLPAPPLASPSSPECGCAQTNKAAGVWGIVLKKQGSEASHEDGEERQD